MANLVGIFYHRCTSYWFTLEEIMELTKKELEEKIAKVKEDLNNLRATGAEEKKIIILAQYIDYLQDELKMARE